MLQLYRLSVKKKERGSAEASGMLGWMVYMKAAAASCEAAGTAALSADAQRTTASEEKLRTV